ncbi:MAG TPA: methylisocitrate lyase [Hyphomicrobiaceae bacterium]|nr:methylisocitrate lyase [Hyphomicrobiaceae bacterium]
MSTWLERGGLERGGLEAAGTGLERAGDHLRAFMGRQGIVRAPGAHNAMAGLLAKEAGFKALYVSGAAVTASMGLPDLGILTIEELAGVVRSIARATDLPLIVDGDTGYGEALNAMRLVRELEMAGAAAVHIEDQVLPKKCGHLNDKSLVPPDQMAAKIAAARKAARHLVVIARTDAAASEGVAGAIRRAKLYKSAGAEVLFADALTSLDEFKAFVEAVDAPVLANMTEFGRTPLMTAEALERIGVKIVIWPVSSLRIAAFAMEGFYRDLARDGTTAPQLDRMQTRKRLYEVIRYHEYEALDASIVKSVLPTLPKGSSS